MRLWRGCHSRSIHFDKYLERTYGADVDSECKEVNIAPEGPSDWQDEAADASHWRIGFLTNREGRISNKEVSGDDEAKKKRTYKNDDLSALGSADDHCDAGSGLSV